MTATPEIKLTKTLTMITTTIVNNNKSLAMLTTQRVGRIIDVDVSMLTS